METVGTLTADHSRVFSLGAVRFASVYPVLSRRSGGISVGINLNLDKGCNFDCVYCQVDRRTAGTSVGASTDQSLGRTVLRELGAFFESVENGDFFRSPPFDRVPSDLQVIRDVAFSGNGEPTLAPSFRTVGGEVRRFLEGRLWGSSDPPLLRLITNGTGLFSRRNREEVRRIFLEGGRGEIWLKLDSADREHFDQINRSSLSFRRMMKGFREVVCDLPVTIQTMVLDLATEGGVVEGGTLWNPLRDLVLELAESGAPIQAWHLYSVARRPAVDRVRRVPADRLESWASEVRPHVPFPVLVFP